MNVAEALARAGRARRILVLGSPGAGKTWFATRLASLRGLELLDLDGELARCARATAGWLGTEGPEWRARVAELAAREAWIMDGTYENSLDLRLPRAELIVLIERSRWACLASALARGRGDRSAPARRLDLGLARYVWRFPEDSRHAILELLGAQGRERDLLVLRRRREVQAFLRALGPPAP